MATKSSIKVILITHAPLGQALYACAEHVLAEAPKLQVVDVLASDLPEPWVIQLVQDIRQKPDSRVLLLCDLYGSTPYHIATAVQRQLTVKGQMAHLLSGVNVSMVIKALTDESGSIDRLIENTLYATQRGIVHQAPTPL